MQNYIGGFFKREEDAATASRLCGGLLVVALVDEDHAADSARRALQASGAVDLQNLTDKWDLNVWSGFNRLPRSSVPQDSRNA
jgi:hypothetical protein